MKMSTETIVVDPETYAQMLEVFDRLGIKYTTGEEQ